MSNLPEPLRTAVFRTARIMATGQVGGIVGGDKDHPYRRDAEMYYEEVLTSLRTAIEATPELSLRTADPSLFRTRPDSDTLFSLVVCDASRPERVVTIMRSVDRLYTVTARSGLTAGLLVRRGDPRRGV